MLRRYSLLIVVALLMLAGMPISQASAATSPSPTPTPDPVKVREARLGGTLEEVQDEHGDPDWTDTDLIGYNEIVLADHPTILVYYYDAEEMITKISLVYLETPADFDEPKTIAEVVAEVLPRDAECEEESVSNGLGDDVYTCTSAALEKIYTASELKKLGIKGDPGTLNYTVDPVADQYYEINVTFGEDLDEPVATKVPTARAEPTARPEPTATTPSAPVALKGRLGGTRASFEAKWGQPNGTVTVNGMSGYSYSDTAIGILAAVVYVGDGPSAFISTIQIAIYGAPSTSQQAAAMIVGVLLAYAPTDYECNTDGSWQSGNSIYIPCYSTALGEYLGNGNFTTEFMLLSDGAIVTIS